VFGHRCTQPPASPVAIDRALERTADRDSDPALLSVAGHGKPDQRSSAVKPLAADRGLEVPVPAQPDAPLHRRLGGQPLATLASAVLHDAHPAPGAHPAQEPVHATAIAFLGLEGSLDGGPLEESRAGENRGSVPEPRRSELDSAHVTSSPTHVPCDVHRALLHSPPGSSRL